MNSDTLTTGEASKTPPRILVTTPSIFHRLLNQKSQLGLGPECYKETQLLAVDGSNDILETTDIKLPENVSLTLEGPKKKYRNILKLIVSTVQKLQMDHYMDSLRRRLKSVEIKAKDQDLGPIPRGFDYTKWTHASNVSALEPADLVRAGESAPWAEPGLKRGSGPDAPPPIAGVPTFTAGLPAEAGVPP